MAELPEVHTITKDLNANIAGFIIQKVVVSMDYNVIPGNSEFTSSVEGKKISGVRRVAKNILIELENDLVIGVHLAMTGRLLLKNPTDENIYDKWTHVSFLLSSTNSSGQDDKHLIFTDVRKFGKVVLMDQKALVNLQGKYGPEPVAKDLVAAKKMFYQNIKHKRTSIKNALLDQTVVSGLGNIYATDALFLAKIHPETPTQMFTPQMAEKLFTAARDILNEGIKHRGSTLPDEAYVDIFGKPGTQQNHFKIYMKKNCPVCNTKVVYKKVNGRGTYFCPVCQPDIRK